jgi:ribulose-5-phosphate 4-epimerase/fuculose-1-phosphate aldolase
MNAWSIHQTTLRGQVSDAEWNARVELAAAYRIFAHLGWTELIYNHLSLRVPDQPGQLLLNPFGLAYDEVRASNLVKIDLDGEHVGPSAWPINVAGVTSHCAVHGAVPDAHCVMHIHTTAGVAVACSSEGLTMSSIYAAQLSGLVAYHDFEGITVHADERARLLGHLEGKPALIMRNHGLLAWGSNVANAFTTLWLLNRACEVQLAARSIGPMLEISPDVQRRCVEDSFHFNRSYGAGQDVFDAMTRRIDKIDPSYRT